MILLRLTGILGLRDNLGKELSKVWEIVAKEASLENKGLSGVGRSQLATKELRLAGNSKCRSFLRVLRRWTG
jgi:hypothetical protein